VSLISVQPNLTTPTAVENIPNAPTLISSLLETSPPTEDIPINTLALNPGNYPPFPFNSDNNFNFDQDQFAPGNPGQTGQFNDLLPPSNPTIFTQSLIAQATNNQNQVPFTPVQPNRPEIPTEIPSLPVPEDIPEDTPPLKPETSPKLIRALISKLLDDSASRYPFLVNTSDKLIINPRNYQPSKFDFYSNFNFNLNKFETSSTSQTEQSGHDIFKSGNISFYPEDEQFYWVLDTNQVVIETQGRHLKVGYQGNYTQENSRQMAKVSTVFWGVQTVVGVPDIFTNLVGEQKLDDLNMMSAAGEIVLPPGASLADNANVSIDVSRPDGSSFKQIIPLDDTRKATTAALLGGGSFFENLDAKNTPTFLQAFPTVNLQPLLNNGVKLETGSIIPTENLTGAGLTFGDFFTQQGFTFNSKMSSSPGTKTLRMNQSDNNDIVAILSNPFLTKEERDFHYLNSLMWYNFGQQSPEINTFSTLNINQTWDRYTLSWSHNRTLLEYDPEKIKLNYYNVFSNPGLSLTIEKLSNTDLNQSVNASLGLIMGSVFSFINPGNINETISKAKEQYNNLQPLAVLETKATSQQRKEMNQRLNNTLNYGNSNSNLSQVSGSYTFAGNITSNSSVLLQMRTGIYERSVQFIEQNIQDWTPQTPVFIDVVRPSDLGPIFFTGTKIPTSITQINTPETVQYSFIRGETSNGEVVFDQSYVFKNNVTSVFTAVPIPAGKSFDIDFGRIKLSTFRQRDIENSSYVGYLYLPSIEFAMSGSINNFSYTLSTGMWFNLSPDSAPMINNNLGRLNANATTESFMGGMLKMSTKLEFTNIFYDQNNKWHTVLANSPFFSLTYNSNPNRLNLSNISTGNVFQFAKPDFNITFYPVLTYYPKILNSDVQSNNIGDLVGFVLLNFSHNTGFDFNSSISLHNETLYQFEATYNIMKNKKNGSLKIGPYYSNYSSANRELENQVENPKYGIVFRYESANSGLVLNSRLGNTDYGLRGEMNLELKF
ncbi:hypothetical protein NWP17_14870, partial [Chrysosporum bergii ANA360D]